MQCHVCGTEVRPEHKFCMECGARLRHPAGELALAPPPPDDEETDRLPALAAPVEPPDVRPGDGPATGHPAATAAAAARRGRHERAPGRRSADGPRRVRPAGRVGPGSGAVGSPIRHRSAVAERGAGYATTSTSRLRRRRCSRRTATSTPPATTTPPGGCRRPTRRGRRHRGSRPRHRQAQRAFRVKPLLIICVLAAAAVVVATVVQVLDISGTGVETLDGCVEAQRLRHEPHRRRDPHRADDGSRGDRLVRRVPLGCRTRRRRRRRPRRVGGDRPRAGGGARQHRPRRSIRRLDGDPRDRLLGDRRRRRARARRAVRLARAHRRRRTGRARPVGRRPRGDGDDRRRDRPAAPDRRCRRRPQLVERPGHGRADGVVRRPLRATRCCCCCAACSASSSSAATASAWRSAARSAPAGWC